MKSQLWQVSFENGASCTITLHGEGAMEEEVGKFVLANYRLKAVGFMPLDDAGLPPRFSHAPY